MDNEHNIPSHLKMQGGTDAEREGASYQQGDTGKAAANSENDTERLEKETAESDPSSSSATGGNANNNDADETVGIP